VGKGRCNLPCRKDRIIKKTVAAKRIKMNEIRWWAEKNTGQEFLYFLKNGPGRKSEELDEEEWMRLSKCVGVRKTARVAEIPRGLSEVFLWSLDGGWSHLSV